MRRTFIVKLVCLGFAALIAVTCIAEDRQMISIEYRVSGPISRISEQGFVVAGEVSITGAMQRSRVLTTRDAWRVPSDKEWQSLKAHTVLTDQLERFLEAVRTEAAFEARYGQLLTEPSENEDFESDLGGAAHGARRQLALPLAGTSTQRGPAIMLQWYNPAYWIAKWVADQVIPSIKISPPKRGEGGEEEESTPETEGK